MHKVLISGSRTLIGYEYTKNLLVDLQIKNPDNLLILHGDCAHGVDWWLERNCIELGIFTAKFPARWKRGKKAGIERNIIMVDIADEVYFIWDGSSKGTKSVIDYARSINKPCTNKIYNS